MSEATDYIVVGAGSAGAVVASRLSEDPSVTVTLIEAGRRERHPLLAMPIAFPMVMADKRFNWSYESEPEPFAEGRRLPHHQHTLAHDPSRLSRPASRDARPGPA